MLTANVVSRRAIRMRLDMTQMMWIELNQCKPWKASMKAVKPDSDPDWGAVHLKNGWVSTGVCLNGFLFSMLAVLHTIVVSLHGLLGRKHRTHYTRGQKATSVGLATGEAVGNSGGKLGQRYKRTNPSCALGMVFSCRSFGAGRINHRLSTLVNPMDLTDLSGYDHATSTPRS